MNSKPIIIFVLIGLFSEIHSAKILIMAPIITRSEYNFFLPIVNSLAGRNHSITLVTSTNSTKVNPSVSQIIPFDALDIYSEFDNPFAMAERGEDLSFLFFDMEWIADLCVQVYENKEFQEKVLRESFNLMIIPSLVHQCFFGLAAKFGTPIILTTTLPPPNYIVRDLGTYFPTSYLPFPTLPFSTDMDIFERTINFLTDLVLQIHQDWSVIPESEKIYQKYLIETKQVGIKDVTLNQVSLILTNTYHGVTHHRPLLPDIVEVGGINCRPAKALPVEIEEFVGTKNAKEGFIYFSLGTCVKGKFMPKEMTDMLMRVFGKLKQRVLWKWKGDDEDFLRRLPQNVMVSNWFPQQDILGHSNLKFFMSHAGIFGIYEALYNGVPLITFPVYFDQFTNSKQAVQQGYAIQLNIYDLKEDSLTSAIQEMITNPRYKETAVTLSNVYHDQRESPAEKAIYWIEYVLRHKGAPHLRSAARKLNFFQFHSLDVILVVWSIIIALGFGIYFTCRRLCSRKSIQPSTRIETRNQHWKNGGYSKIPKKNSKND